MSRPHTTRPADLVALVLAPVLLGAAMLLDLTPDADGTAELLGLVGESPQRWLLSNSLFLLSGLAWTVAGIGLYRRLGRRSRTIGIGAIGVAAGGVALGLIEATVLYLPGLARSGASLDQQVRTVEYVESSAPTIAFEVVHVAGWLLGLLLVAVGLLLRRAVPRWIPATMLAGLAGMLAFSDGPGLATASAVLVVAVTGLALHLARPDQQSRPAVDRAAVSAA
jgi:hypothetical protein